MVRLFLIDGLGNQMFQYAFARVLQMRKGTSLCLNTRMNQALHKPRLYGLDKLSIPKNVHISKGPAAWIDAWFLKLYLYVLNRKFDIRERYYGRWLIYAQVDDVYSYRELDVKHISKEVRIFGQFQTFKWFEPYADVIKAELRVKAPQSAANQNISSAISASNSVCVHIRRGDYTDPSQKCLQVCDYRYYMESMEYIAQRQVNPTFFVFSNSHEDIEWIRQNYDFSKYNVYYVDQDNPDYEELRLMYSCKHFIISNSTFSWWAQYLSTGSAKIVCAPSEWNRNERVDCSNIYMPEWHLIGV